MSEETCELCLGVGYVLCGICNSVDPAARIAELEDMTTQQSVQIENLSAQLAAKDTELAISIRTVERQRNAQCGKCRRALAPDGDCYGCSSDILVQENYGLRTELSCFESMKQGAEIRIGDLETQLAAKSAELDIMAEQLLVRDRTIEHLQKELADEASADTETAETVEAITAENDHLRKQVTDLEAEIRWLNQYIKDST